MVHVPLGANYEWPLKWYISWQTGQCYFVLGITVNLNDKMIVIICYVDPWDMLNKFVYMSMINRH